MANWAATNTLESYAMDNSTLVVAAQTANYAVNNRATISNNTLIVETVSINVRPTIGQLFPR